MTIVIVLLCQEESILYKLEGVTTYLPVIHLRHLPPIPLLTCHPVFRCSRGHLSLLPPRLSLPATSSTISVTPSSNFTLATAPSSSTTNHTSPSHSYSYRDAYPVIHSIIPMPPQNLPPQLIHLPHYPHNPA